MRRFRQSLGGRLRSIALRYGQPIGAAGRFSGLNLKRPRWLLRTLGSGEIGETPTESPGPTEKGETARDEVLARLEAILFLARPPHSSRRLAQLAGLADGTEARTLVRKLNRLYDSEGCAFRVEEVAGGLQLMSRARFAPWLRRLTHVPVEIRLSAPAMETLAVVAYRQPVLRADIEAIRGVQCGEMLRQLIERDLVRIAGRSEELGRPLLYGTTRRFLEVFGLRHLDELPRRESLMPASAPAMAAHPAGESQDSLCQPNHSHQAEEEKNVKAVATPDMHADELPPEGAAFESTPSGEQSDEEFPFDEVEDAEFDDDDEEEEEEYEEDDDDFDEDYDDDEDTEEDEDTEDDDFEEDEWEEVDDEEEEEDDDEEDEDDEEWDDETEEEEYEDDEEEWEDDDWEEEDEDD